MYVEHPDAIYILCDANEISGMGHFVRCISLAKALQQLNFKIYFIGDFNLQAQQFAEYFSQQLQLVSATINERITSLPENSSILIDSYSYSTQTLPSTYRYILIDDFCQHETYPVLAVLNFTLAAGRFDYIVKGAKHQALGVKYYLPHPAIVGLSLIPRVTIKRLLIMIGSGDTHNLSLRLYKLIKNIDPLIEIKVVSTSVGERQFSDIAPECLIAPTPEVDLLYRWADFCITSGGLAKYELAYLAKPAAVLPLTEGEAAETGSFSQAGLCFNLGSIHIGDNELTERLERVLSSCTLRAIAHHRCRVSFSESSALNAANFIKLCLSEN